MGMSIEQRLAIMGLTAISAAAACGPRNYDHLPPVPKPPVVVPSDPRMAPDWNLTEWNEGVLDRDMTPAFGPQLPLPDIFMSNWSEWKKRVEAARGRVRMYRPGSKLAESITAGKNPLLNQPDLSGRGYSRRCNLSAGEIFPYQVIVEALVEGQTWSAAGVLIERESCRIVREVTPTTVVKAVLVARPGQSPRIRSFDRDQSIRGAEMFWPYQ